MLLLSSFSFANTRDLSFETEVANSLYGLGLFKGTGNGNYELDKQPSRIEAVIMLIRLTGKEENALSRYWKHPFKDVPEWATKYVG